MNEIKPVEIEVTRKIDLTEQHVGVLDMHSFLNLFNVLLGELYLIAMDAGSGQPFPQTIALVEQVKALLEDRNQHQTLGLRLEEMPRLFETELKTFAEARPDLSDTPAMIESVANVRSVCNVMKVRVAEYLERIDQPDAWKIHRIATLRDNFCNFFAALERNSKGRFHIVFNIAAQEEGDYVVNLSIESREADTIAMPPVLQDVFRDLIANARKYTAPGGSITAGLKDDGEKILLAVSDNGLGIPVDEIEKVVEFGYRATNARDRRTQGGGFGLTKAYATAKRFKGRMWIKSNVGLGTKITIHIPRPV